MTLMALSLAIGILIDDAIVVRENITRHAEMGKDHVTAAREGTAEIGPAVIATTLSILAVFIPVAFMGGIVGTLLLLLRHRGGLRRVDLAVRELHPGSHAQRRLARSRAREGLPGVPPRPPPVHHEDRGLVQRPGGQPGRPRTARASSGPCTTAAMVIIGGLGSFVAGHGPDGPAGRQLHARLRPRRPAGGLQGPGRLQPGSHQAQGRGDRADHPDPPRRQRRTRRSSSSTPPSAPASPAPSATAGST